MREDDRVIYIGTATKVHEQKIGTCEGSEFEVSGHTMIMVRFDYSRRNLHPVNVVNLMRADAYHMKERT